jgi:hypothetical protein
MWLWGLVSAKLIKVECLVTQSMDSSIRVVNCTCLAVQNSSSSQSSKYSAIAMGPTEDDGGRGGQTWLDKAPTDTHTHMHTHTHKAPQSLDKHTGTDIDTDTDTSRAASR